MTAAHEQGFSAWQRSRVAAAARAFADKQVAESDHSRAERAVHAADDAVGGVIPREDYERLAIEYSAWKVRALQADDLIARALDALDRIAGCDEHADTEPRKLALVTATELRVMLAAQRQGTEEEDASGVEDT